MPDAKVLKAQKRQKREEVASASLDRVYAAAAAADQIVRGGTQRKKRDRNWRAQIASQTVVGFST